VGVHNNHSCGVTADGGAYCWGSNLHGQLGNGEPPTQEDPVAVVPTSVVGGATFRFVTLGGGHTCGVTTAGVSLCWGYGGLGQLGAGVGQFYNSTPAAVAVADGQVFDSLSAGAEHTCGLTAEGEAFCWGANHRGQLGDGTTEHRSLPTPVQGGLTFRSLRAAGTTTCGITIAGAAYCWGLGEFGQLGAGDLESSSTPTLVHGGLVFTSLSTFGTHACGLTPTGDAYCWGSNFDGKLGDGTTTDRRVPTLVTGGLTFISLSAGAGHTCGLVSNGALFCWGANYAGQLGDGTRESTPHPRRIAGPA
jgi:alpha-tubulin suppressor-like RCC1 family protein